MYFTQLQCCGIKELTDLSQIGKGREADALFDLTTRYQGSAPTFPGCRFAIFSQAGGLEYPESPACVFADDDEYCYGCEECEPRPAALDPDGYGYRFADFIRANNLGDVEEGPEDVNPNSNHRIKMWIWNVDREAMINWVQEQIKARDWKFVPPVSPTTLDSPPAGAAGANPGMGLNRRLFGYYAGNGRVRP